MWEYNDLNNFRNLTSRNEGQINNDSFSEWIRKLTSDKNNKNILEIGTWNGLGSTKQFVETLRERNDDYLFYSLECNKEKCDFAKKLYKDDKNVFILNEVIWNKHPPDFLKIFPQVINTEMYKKWHNVDIINMKKCKLFLERENLPKKFDILLLDGGEFTTYYEYKLLKDKCKYLLLDDTKVEKCRLIVEDIKSNDDTWEIIIEDLTTRNGIFNM